MINEIVVEKKRNGVDPGGNGCPKTDGGYEKRENSLPLVYTGIHTPAFTNSEIQHMQKTIKLTYNPCNSKNKCIDHTNTHNHFLGSNRLNFVIAMGGNNEIDLLVLRGASCKFPEFALQNSSTNSGFT